MCASGRHLAKIGGFCSVVLSLRAFPPGKTPPTFSLTPTFSVPGVASRTHRNRLQMLTSLYALHYPKPGQDQRVLYCCPLAKNVPSR